ncbi:MAG: VanZ family protein [Nocardioidaceae bacterium]|nr:VanZ family protein [Nocardioidaceae bacterium]
MALAVLVVLGPIVGAWAGTRPRAAWFFWACALLPVVLLTLVPTARDVGQRCEVAWMYPTIGRVELAANVVLFVAPVLFLGVALRRPLVALLAGLGLSAGIEAIQALLPALGRSCSTNDWLSNAIGAVIGAALAWAALQLIRVRR